MAAHLTVIDGGATPGAPKPVVWNRAPCGAPQVLVIRDSPDAWEPVWAAYDDGRDFLVGIRAFRLPADAAALQAWLDLARAAGQVIRDERTARPLMDGGISMRQQIQLELRRRARTRAVEPLPAGGLFDQVARDTQELF